MSQSSELEPIDDYQQQLQTSMWQAVTEQLPTPSAEATALLQQQNITATEPGTILTDFQTLLDFVGESSLAVSLRIYSPIGRASIPPNAISPC